MHVVSVLPEIPPLRALGLLGRLYSCWYFWESRYDFDFFPTIRSWEKLSENLQEGLIRYIWTSDGEVLCRFGGGNESSPNPNLWGKKNMLKGECKWEKLVFHTQTCLGPQRQKFSCTLLDLAEGCPIVFPHFWWLEKKSRSKPSVKTIKVKSISRGRYRETQLDSFSHPNLHRTSSSEVQLYLIRPSSRFSDRFSSLLMVGKKCKSYQVFQKSHHCDHEDC